MTTQQIQASALVTPENRASLPAHGPVGCRKCWPTNHAGNVFTTSDQRFRVVNDPGAWGSQNPAVLVLGISKGFTQAREFADGEFDSVPFKNCRTRLRDVLATVGIMEPEADIDDCMKSSETNFAWGSVVRCSLSGWNTTKRDFFAGTPEVLPAFKHAEASRFLRGCMREHLADLPDRTRIVVLLGNDDRYVDTIAQELQRMYAGQYSRVSAVAHKAGERLWVHIAHPSPGNGHFTAFIDGPTETPQGLKRELARQVLSAVSSPRCVDARENSVTTHVPATPIPELARSFEPKLPIGTFVPVAADGTWFGPHLRRATGFTVGEKGNEQRFESFLDALEFLRKIPTARWRRPNREGNWGTVSARCWKRFDEVGLT